MISTGAQSSPQSDGQVISSVPAHAQSPQIVEQSDGQLPGFSSLLEQIPSPQREDVDAL